METVEAQKFDSKNFLLELCKYYMEFLETDFRQKRAPKRRTDAKNSNALLVSVPLATYTGLNQSAIKLLQSLLENNKFAKIAPGQHVIEFPTSATEEIAAAIEGKITKNNIDEIKEAVLKIATKVINKLNVPDKEKALENLNDLLEAREILTITSTKPKIVSFFRQYIVADFYKDLYELWKNKSILDKQDFYIYFFTISGDDNSYPIFYLPVNIQQTEDGNFSLEPDARLLVHKKAIEFLAQRTKEEKQKISLPQRHIYINEEKDGLVGLIVKTLNEISDFFGLDRIAFDGKEIQVIQGSQVAISNNCYFAIFDKSDEALLNDYEELITLALQGTGGIFEIFKKLSEEFILEEPINCNIEVTDEYHDTPLGGKLSYQSPIPLNQEQIQILSALDKEDVKRIIVEGPPGTGKSHTITAIIYNALLKGKSVLVVSDKKEALDVVENNISGVLEKTRLTDDFVQNPILRLENRNNNFNKIFKPINFKKIEDRYIAERNTSERLGTEITSVSKRIVEGTDKEVDNLSSLDFEKIKYVIKAEDEIKREWDGLVDLKELTDVADGGGLITRLFEIVSPYKEKIDKLKKFSNYLKSGKEISPDLISVIDKIIGLLENLEVLLKDFNENELSIISDLAARHPDIKLPEEKMLSTENAFNKVNDTFERYGAILAKIVSPKVRLPLSTLEYEAFCGELGRVASVVDKLQIYYKKNFSSGDALLLKDIKAEKIASLESYITSVESLRRPVIGFLFQGEALKRLARQFQGIFPFANVPEPHKRLDTLQKELQCFRLIEELSKDLTDAQYFEKASFGADGIEKTVKDEALGSIKAISEELTSLTNDFTAKLSKLKDEKYFIAAREVIGEHALDFRNLRRFYDLADFVSKVREVNQLSQTNQFNLAENEEYHQPKIEEYFKLQHIHGAKNRMREMKELVAFLWELEDNREELEVLNETTPETLSKLKITAQNIVSLAETKLNDFSKEDVEGLANYLGYQREIVDTFSRQTMSNYRNVRESLENRLVAKMTYILDEKVVQYANTHQNTYRQLAKVIREKRKIPKEDLGALVKAFPCLIIGIRDLGDYLPLESGIFDVVIIDEASQVSIAQAFPAIIRGKKVVVFGDEKQYSNVKTSTADKEINNASFNKVKEVYLDAIHTLSPGRIEKIRDVSERFNIKSSILDFLKNLANYHCSLKKHFRGYQELMSYSNNTFYNGLLQIMKLRAKSIEEVIKFDVIQPDLRQEVYKNTNPDEAAFILNKLNELKESGEKISVGIITPFSNQQKFINDKVEASDNADYFKKVFNIKVMTFDTAQGEERDIIFYSMVEKEGENILRYIFPVSFKNLEDEEEGNLKAQRLNVGLSRAKETVHFVLSKKLEDIKGEIGNALRHFHRQLEDGKRLPKTDKADSEMEKILLHYIQQTNFYKENSENIEIIPQFEIGKYLKQISSADIPDYRVDFMMILHIGGKDKILLLEYDGFEYHFKGEDDVNQFNYDRHYVEQDVERQRILESYGYEFLRVNKFILREDPVGELDKRFAQWLKKKL